MKNNEEKAYFAGGCFWGVEYYFQKAPGVISVKSGYMGGHTENPKYDQVCNHQTGHAETVEVIFDTSLVSFEELAKLFFEIHDPTQSNRQGPDIGDQYRSEIFYSNEEQKKIAEKLINFLKNKDYDVVTKLTPTKNHPFWEAENYHQRHYLKNGKEPYCHVHKKIF